MDSKERVIAALDFQTLDKIPTSYEFFWPKFVAKCRKEKKISGWNYTISPRSTKSTKQTQK